MFDDAFAVERDQRLLWRIGFTPEQITRGRMHKSRLETLIGLSYFKIESQKGN